MEKHHLRFKSVLVGSLLATLGIGQTLAQDSSVDAGLGLTQQTPQSTPTVRTPQRPKRTVVIPERQPTTGASWARSSGTGQRASAKTQGPGQEQVQGYPYYTMEGLFASVCNAPYNEAKRDCPNMSSVQALGAMQLLMYYGNLIGPDSVLVVMPKSKLGDLAGTDADAKLNEMTRNFRAKNARQTSAARTN